MSDLDRLAADLGAALGTHAVPTIRLDGDRGPRRARLEQLRAELAEAPALLITVRDEGLAGGDDSGGSGAVALEEDLRAAGLEPDWIGITDAVGGVGRRAGITALVAGNGRDDARELIAAGPLGLRFDRAVDLGKRSRARVCIVSYEFVGPTRTGGIGTAYTSLAEALAADGHEVVVLFSGEEDDSGSLHEWTAHYRQAGVELHGLPPHQPTSEDPAYRHQIRAHQVYEWLRDAVHERGFDVIHFPEVLGHGYFAVRAKRQGLAFADATLVVGTHSSTSWVLETNGALMQAQGDFIDDFCEREAVAGADVVVSPSAYMLDWVRANGWELPARSFVQQYVRSGAVARLVEQFADRAGEPPDGTAGTEIVFFGRLEPRKGLRVFCDALDRVAERGGAAPRRITFLGKESMIDGIPAGEFIARHAARWPWDWEVISDLNQPEAVAYLTAPGPRLTVIPSLADNSPNTVYEALALRLGFIASRVGGTAELIDPRDLAAATFDPGDAEDEHSQELGASRLADKLAAALAADELVAPRAAVDAEVCRQAHVEWHAAVAAARERTAAKEAPAGDRPVSVCVIGTDPELVARTRASLGDAGEIVEAASHEGAEPSGEYVLYLDAGVVLDPGAPAALATALANCGRDLIAVPIADEGKPGELLRLPTGGPAIAGLFRRAFGDSTFMITASALARLDGFDPGVAADVQAHLLLCRAAIEGLELDVAADVLARARARDLRDLEIALPSRRIAALVELYSNAPEPILRQLPLLSQQVWAALGVYEDAYSHLYRYRFGRYSVHVRYFVHKYRQLQALWRRVRSKMTRRRPGGAR